MLVLNISDAHSCTLRGYRGWPRHKPSPGHAAVTRRWHATFNGYGPDHREADGGGGLTNRSLLTYCKMSTSGSGYCGLYSRSAPSTGSTVILLMAGRSFVVDICHSLRPRLSSAISHATFSCRPALQDRAISYIQKVFYCLINQLWTSINMTDKRNKHEKDTIINNCH